MEHTLAELGKRHSVRNYLIEPIPEELRKRLMADVTMVNSHEAGLNMQLVFDDPDPLGGFRHSYGMFRNGRNYLAPVVDPTFDNAVERAGYFAQQWVMGAVCAGLGTCFISGTYSSSLVKARMEVYEKLPFIVAFGYSAEKPVTGLGSLMAKFAHRKKMVARDFFQGSDDEYARAKSLYPWLDTGLEGMACAPTAMNRREIRVRLNGDNLETCSQGECNPIDLGIAKYNFVAPLPVDAEWEWGENGQLVIL